MASVSPSVFPAHSSQIARALQRRHTKISRSAVPVRRLRLPALFLVSAVLSSATSMARPLRLLVGGEFDLEDSRHIGMHVVVGRDTVVVLCTFAYILWGFPKMKIKIIYTPPTSLSRQLFTHRRTTSAVMNCGSHNKGVELCLFSSCYPLDVHVCICRATVVSGEDVEFFIGRNLLDRVLIQSLVQLQITPDKESPRAPGSGRRESVHRTRSPENQSG